MSKKKKQQEKAWCGQCGKAFLLAEATEAYRHGRALIHDCGKVLVRERGNAAVPTHNHIGSNSDYTSERSNPSTGDEG